MNLVEELLENHRRAGMLKPSHKPKQANNREVEAGVQKIELKESVRKERNTRNILSKKASTDVTKANEHARKIGAANADQAILVSDGDDNEGSSARDAEETEELGSSSLAAILPQSSA